MNFSSSPCLVAASHQTIQFLFIFFIVSNFVQSLFTFFHCFLVLKRRFKKQKNYVQTFILGFCSLFLPIAQLVLCIGSDMAGKRSTNKLAVDHHQYFTASTAYALATPD
jgi:hypothetical protein